MAEAQGGLIQVPIAFSPPTGGHPTGKEKRGPRSGEFASSILGSRGGKSGTGTEIAAVAKAAV